MPRRPADPRAVGSRSSSLPGAADSLGWAPSRRQMQEVSIRPDAAVVDPALDRPVILQLHRDSEADHDPAEAPVASSFQLRREAAGDEPAAVGLEDFRRSLAVSDQSQPASGPLPQPHRSVSVWRSETLDPAGARAARSRTACGGGLRTSTAVTSATSTITLARSCLGLCRIPVPQSTPEIAWSGLSQTPHPRPATAPFILPRPLGTRSARCPAIPTRAPPAIRRNAQTSGSW
jgi:hypothetical protein